MKWISLGTLFFCIVSTSLAGTRYFPQVGNGTADDLAFRTSIELINTGSSALVQVSCFNDDGIPWPLEWSLPGLNESSVVAISVDTGK